MKNIALGLLVLALAIAGFFLLREQGMNGALRTQLAAAQDSTKDCLAGVEVSAGKVVLVMQDGRRIEKYVPPDGTVKVGLGSAGLREKLRGYLDSIAIYRVRIQDIRIQQARGDQLDKQQQADLEARLWEAENQEVALQRKLRELGQPRVAADTVRVKDRGFCLKPGYGVCIYQTAEVDPKLYLQLAYVTAYNTARTRGAQYSLNLGGGLRAVDVTLARTLSDLWRPLEHAELAAGAGVFYRGAVDGLGMKPNRRTGLALSLGVKGKF